MYSILFSVPPQCIHTHTHTHTHALMTGAGFCLINYTVLITLIVHWGNPHYPSPSNNLSYTASPHLIMFSSREGVCTRREGDKKLDEQQCIGSRLRVGIEIACRSVWVTKLNSSTGHVGLSQHRGQRAIPQMCLGDRAPRQAGALDFYHLLYGAPENVDMFSHSKQTRKPCLYYMYAITAE